ncbi:hypothetical protein [Thermoclostridium stercorarium]|uniref:hypothetical protein n=1 Tax=Thermoclostridium stercorarium TaxID=1510 RepID=UPI002093DB83|nr:hypothetical protein [Thermoclostridium stercorarium]
MPGFCAEKYSIGLEEGFIEARARMDSELRKLITRHIAADEVRNLRVRTSYSNVKFKHILLPVWIAAYRYGDRIYKFVVNGQTGLVKGEAPVSIVKAAAIAVVVLSLIVLYYFYRTNG